MSWSWPRHCCDRGKAAIAASAAALLAFSAFLTFLATRGSSVPCGCIGDLVGNRGRGVGIARNLCLLGLLALAASQPGDPSAVTLAVGAQVALLLILLSEGLPIIASILALKPRSGAS